LRRQTRSQEFSIGIQTVLNTERAVLLTGQAISDAGDPPRARALFTGFMNVVSSAASIPGVQLAIARTYEKENDWTNAIQQYERWLNVFTNHAARPQAEYFPRVRHFTDRGQDQCVCKFHELHRAFSQPMSWPPRLNGGLLTSTTLWAPLAAPKTVTRLFSPSGQQSELANQAQMMAGRAAFKRQSLGDADKYFTNLCNNPNCPVELKFQALFAHGDTLGSEGNQTNYVDAMNVFRLIAPSRLFYTNKLAALALGQRACYALQWAQSSTENDKYETVSNAFMEVINSATGRCQSNQHRDNWPGSCTRKAGTTTT